MAHGEGSPIKAILYAFVANLGIAIAKTAAAAFTGSSSMLAESLHSYADTGNQLLLLLGMKRAKRPPDREHPLGYGKVTYFWSFIVAILLFSVGGLFSLYEGWHKFHEPEALQNAWVAFVVLGLSIGLEAASMAGCLREVNRVRGGRSLWRWLHQSRCSELLVVFGEDLAALLGLILAVLFLSLASITGDGRFDACGSLCIGVLLVVVALFLSARVKALLIGRSADPELIAAIEEEIAGDDGILEVFNVITLQMGPQVMFAAKIRMDNDVTLGEACRKINSLEKKLKERFPEIGWSFVEPDNLK
jgi:cation diffusion facilitator family transporter